MFARVGDGHLGYVGDVNGEQGTVRLLLEMCGVKIKPGDMGSRTHTTGVQFSGGRVVSSEKTTDEEIPLPGGEGPRERRPRETEVEARAAERARNIREMEARGDVLKNEVSMLDAPEVNNTTRTNLVHRVILSSGQSSGRRRQLIIVLRLSCLVQSLSICPISLQPS